MVKKKNKLRQADVRSFLICRIVVHKRGSTWNMDDVTFRHVTHILRLGYCWPSLQSDKITITIIVGSDLCLA